MRQHPETGHFHQILGAVRSPFVYRSDNWSPQAMNRISSMQRCRYRKRDVRSWSPQGGKLGANRSDSTCQCRTAVGRQQAHPVLFEAVPEAPSLALGFLGEYFDVHFPSMTESSSSFKLWTSPWYLAIPGLCSAGDASQLPATEARSVSGAARRPRGHLWPRPPPPPPAPLCI